MKSCFKRRIYHDLTQIFSSFKKYFLKINCRPGKLVRQSRGSSCARYYSRISQSHEITKKVRDLPKSLRLSSPHHLCSRINSFWHSVLSSKDLLLRPRTSFFSSSIFHTTLSGPEARGVDATFRIINK